MKRLWIGVGVLLALLGVGVWAMDYADRTQGHISQLLDQAAEAALVENWQEASRLRRQAQAMWEESWSVTAALWDHTELDGIDAGFARLEIYGRDGHATDFAAESAALARQVEALGEGHRLSLRNLF